MKDCKRVLVTQNTTNLLYNSECIVLKGVMLST